MLFPLLILSALRRTSIKWHWVITTHNKGPTALLCQLSNYNTLCPQSCGHSTPLCAVACQPLPSALIRSRTATLWRSNDLRNREWDEVSKLDSHIKEHWESREPKTPNRPKKQSKKETIEQKIWTQYQPRHTRCYAHVASLEVVSGTWTLYRRCLEKTSKASPMSCRRFLSSAPVVFTMFESVVLFESSSSVVWESAWLTRPRSISGSAAP
jgi:hypothetical protein